MTLEKQIIVNLIKASQFFTDELANILKIHDLSNEQFNVLRILRGQNKPTNMGTIQERMVAKTSNTTRLVDKLLLKNLVERKTCEKNRRKIEVEITAKGLQLLKKTDPLIIKHDLDVLQNLTQQEKETLLNLILKIN